MLSLVVATLGRTHELERLFASLERSEVRAREVIIVDQNEGDLLAPVLSQFSGLRLRHLRSEPGLSHARNIGLASACEEVVGFPDDDCWYGPGTIGTVLRLFAHHADAGILSGRTCNAAGVESVSTHRGVSQDIGRAEVFHAGNSNGLFVRRSVLQEIGGFDETLGVGARFGSGEETDFLLRALRAGFRVRHEPEITVFHDHVPTSVDRVQRYAPGYGRVRRLHGLGFPARDLTRAMLRATALEMVGDRTRAREKTAWVLGVLRGYAAGTLPPQSAGKRDQVLGIRFSARSADELVRLMLEEPVPGGSGPRLVVTANVDHVVKLRSQADFRAAYASAWAVTADGMPVYAYARSRGLKHLQRITGCELLGEMVAGLAPGRHRCFFVVGSGAVAKRLEALLLARGFDRKQYDLIVPPLGFERARHYCAEVARRIRAFRPTHLVLGVGAPKSEVFAHQYRNVLGDCYVLCVGSAVDVVAGVTVRAPALMRRAGFEWLWRVSREPARLFPRYFISSWGFLRIVWADLHKS